MCKVYTGYCGTSNVEHGLCACTVDNPLAKARGLFLSRGAQTMFYLSYVCINCAKSKIDCVETVEEVDYTNLSSCINNSKLFYV